MQTDLRKKATQVVQMLKNNNFEAYFVGGAVRDILLGKKPKDIDIVTSATPDQIEGLFENVHPVGKQFGVMLVNSEGEVFEVATFREESGYEDKRRPDRVKWTTAKQDVLRRDFTVNGLLLDPLADKIIDFVEGERDLKIKVLKFIGNPKKRIAEDPLRILRAIRLKNQLGFYYDKETFDALKDLREEVKHVSSERIGHEIDLMLGNKNRVGVLEDLDKLDLMEIILPEVDNLKGTPQPNEFHQEGDVFDHAMQAVSTLENEAPSFLAFATLLHDVGKPKVLEYPKENGRITTFEHAKVSSQIAQQILRRLKFPRTYIDTVCWMIEKHMSLKGIESMRPNKKELFLLDPRFPWLLELHKADALGAKPADLSLYAHNLNLYEAAKAEHEKAKIESKPVLINGYDLQRALKLDPSPKIGELLEEIRDQQLRGEITTKEEAIEFARKNIN